MGYLGEFEQLILFSVLQLGEGAYGVAIREIIEERTGRVVSSGAIYTALGVCAAEAQAAGQDGSGVCGDVADWGHDGLGRGVADESGWLGGRREGRAGVKSHHLLDPADRRLGHPLAACVPALFTRQLLGHRGYLSGSGSMTATHTRRCPAPSGPAGALRRPGGCAAA